MEPLPCGLKRYNPPHFLEWYMAAAGQSEVPPEFHLWAGIQLLTASMANRVWVEKLRGSRLMPNLYVMFIADSGIGKGVALETAENLTKRLSPEHEAQINLYRGKISAQAIINELSDRMNQQRPNYIWLQTPELAMAIGYGPRASDFCKHMTEYYGGGGMQDRTRTSGHFSIRDHMCINWGAGTTFEWLVDTVDQRDILSGFFARVCGIVGEDRDVRFVRPVYPDTHGEIQGWLDQYVAHLTTHEGAMVLTDAAYEYEQFWYNNRPRPADKLLLPFWRRQDSLMLKLAQALAKGDGFRWEIEPRHIEDAIGLTEWLAAHLPGIFRRVLESEELQQISWLRHFLVGQGRIMEHGELAGWAAGKGIGPDQLRDALRALQENDELLRRPGQSGRGTWYEMIRRN